MKVPVDSTYILPLDAAEASIARVGGKGASLAKMARAGLCVPPGFHLTVAAYRRFVETNGLKSTILDLAQSIQDAEGDAPSSLERAEAEIRARFEEGAMPPEVARALTHAYAELGIDAPAVAVRSSATAEDLPGLSFAGQQESYLNVCGDEELLTAVRRCWASLWTARAIRYRGRMGVDHKTVAMAVIVQRMVRADVSGVLFTANPTTGDRSEMVVNAAFGLGEAVVAGHVSPDVYIVDKTSFRLKEMTVGTKEIMVVPAPKQGVARAAVATERRRQRALSDQLLRAVADLGLRVERHAGGIPQDIEWAVAGGTCWLLQARPITRLAPQSLHVQWEPPEPGTGWIRRQVVENMPEPLSPLFADLYLSGLDRAVDALQDMMDIPNSVLKLIKKPIATTVNGYAYMRATVDFRWSAVPALLWVTLSSFRSLFKGLWVNYWRDKALPEYLETIRSWNQCAPPAAADEVLLEGVCELARADARYWFGASVAVGSAKLSEALLNAFLTVAAPRRGLTSAVFLRGLEPKTLQAQAELETIAQRIRESDRLRELVAKTPAARLVAELGNTSEAKAVREAIRTHLDRFGHQIYTLDFAVPTQAEDPLPVLMSLKAMVDNPGQGLRLRQQKLAQERDRAVSETARSFDPIRRPMFLWFLRRAQQFAPCREEALFYMGAAWPTLRQFALELGRRLTEAGLLAGPDDVFYLESAELRQAIAARASGERRPDLVRLAAERRTLQTARQRLHPPAAVPPEYRFRLGPFDMSFWETQRRHSLNDATISGFAVSPGRVSAPASVILSPSDFDKMEPGTILVCPTTTPAWTPLFAQARGVVTDIGGVLAHGTIIAREYGIPAVMGTGNATQWIKHGQLVTVDGNSGTVKVLE
ncbi:MAG: phosphoenolpyruvate synthase [Firmicutes bacterium]|nr:phosphoenolpyruvate synthase [Bacillota bacterium]